MKRLIVNADDFGRTVGVNEGTLEAYVLGIVTSATVMVLEPAAEQGIALARAAAPGLGLGLHFAVTGGSACASPPAEGPTAAPGCGFRKRVSPYPIFSSSPSSGPEQPPRTSDSSSPTCAKA